MSTSVYNDQTNMHHSGKYRPIDLDHLSKHSSTIPLAQIKLNTKKFPENFFGKVGKRPPLPPRLLKINKQRAQTDRKYNMQNQYLENNEQILPQAQITSFFKMADCSIATTQVSPVRAQKFYSETKLKEDENNLFAYLNCEDRQIATSIQLNNEPEFEDINNLLCTFAKKKDLTELNSLKTPMKKYKGIRQDNISTTKGKSVELIKAGKQVNRFEDGSVWIPKINSKVRKASFQVSAQHKVQTARKSSSRNYKRKCEDILLPKINRFH